VKPIPDALSKKRNEYEPAFILLVRDFLRVCEYIEPLDAHLHVYSHRLYELLLRACTEFESLSREILHSQGYAKRDNLNIKDFLAIAPDLELQRQTASVVFWRPEPIWVTPYETWSEAHSSLQWYREYNAVKHNRNVGFSHANLRNVRDAVSAVFIILARLDFIEPVNSLFSAPGGTWQGTIRYRDVPFSLRYETQILPGTDSGGGT
jgi:hypothetical protein